MHFMASSLEKLVNNLEPVQFKHTLKYFQSDQLDLMLKKGVYRYEYMDSQSKLTETQLPQNFRFWNLRQGLRARSKCLENVSVQNPRRLYKTVLQV